MRISELISQVLRTVPSIWLTVVEVLFLFFLNKINRNTTCLFCVYAHMPMCVVSQHNASCNIKENGKEISYCFNYEAVRS